VNQELEKEQALSRMLCLRLIQLTATCLKALRPMMPINYKDIFGPYIIIMVILRTEVESIPAAGKAMVMIKILLKHM
jgi:hypothetical protein